MDKPETKNDDCNDAANNSVEWIDEEICETIIVKTVVVVVITAEDGYNKHKNYVSRVVSDVGLKIVG